MPNLRILESKSKYVHVMDDLEKGKMKGQVHLEGYTQCNGNLCRVVAKIDLSTCRGTGHVVPLEDTGGFCLSEISNQSPLVKKDSQSVQKKNTQKVSKSPKSATKVAPRESPKVVPKRSPKGSTK